MKLIRFDELKARGIVENRTTHRRWVDEAGFPAPIPLGDNSSATDFDLVEIWVMVRGFVPAILATVKAQLSAGAAIVVDEIVGDLLARHPLPDGTAEYVRVFYADCLRKTVERESDRAAKKWKATGGCDYRKPPKAKGQPRGGGAVSAVEAVEG